MQSNPEKNHDKRAAKERKDELGQTLVEYSLILLLVALLVIVPVSQIGTTVLQFLTSVAGGF